MPPASPIKGMPLYLQVRDEIVRRITTGRHRPGSWLPNESELSQEMNVSLGTIRRAMSALETQCLIRREQGRGTRVLDPASPVAVSHFNNLRNSEGQRVDGQVVRLSQEIVSANREQASRLRLSPGEKIGIEVRTRIHNGTCIVFEQIVLAMSRFPGLMELPQGDYRLPPLAFKHGVLVSQSVEEVLAVHLDAAIALHFDLPPRTLGLKLDRIVYANTGDALQWRVGYIPSNQLRYVAENSYDARSSLVTSYMADRAADNDVPVG